jgi:hypothetical protein
MLLVYGLQKINRHVSTVGISTRELCVALIYVLMSKLRLRSYDLVKSVIEINDTIAASEIFIQRKSSTP